MEMEGEINKKNKGSRVCVTGGAGYVGSWLIKRLLQHGFSVNATIQLSEQEKGISHLTNLPGAAERLRVFVADLDEPGSFNAPIAGCMGVFHLAHPISLEDKEYEETKTKRAINGTIGVLQACLDSKTVKKVVHTSSAGSLMFSGKDLRVVDETSWTDTDVVRSLKIMEGPYIISKTLTERAALEFASTHGLDLVTLIPTYIHGPFLTPHCPVSVRLAMAMFFGDKNHFDISANCNAFVHVDDVASAYIFLLECPTAKGRCICSATEISTYELHKFQSKRYPEYKIPLQGFLEQDKESVKVLSYSSKKLLDVEFTYKYGIEEMYDEAIQSCKQKGLL